MVDEWHLMADTIHAEQRPGGKRIYRWNGTHWAEQMRWVIGVDLAREAPTPAPFWCDMAPQPADLNAMTLEEWGLMVEALVEELPHAGE